MARKKGEEEGSPFCRWKRQEEREEGTKASGAAATAEAPLNSSKVNLLCATLSALLSMFIPPLSSRADMPRVVEGLKTKMWFEANQAHVMAEAIAKERALACHTGVVALVANTG
jgi:hypothetical protein